MFFYYSKIPTSSLGVCVRSIYFVLLLALVLCAAESTASSAREYGGRYTSERIANLRQNSIRYEWAKASKAKAIENARPWLATSDEELWHMVPGQDLPRCIDVTWDYNKDPHRTGCLKCGDGILKFGNYPYNPDIQKNPWKLTCPSCGAVFPTNDFGKFYTSAIDEHGLFNPAKGDRSLLFNAEHPDPSDPLHMFGVDDGFGYVDETGRVHKFIGYYTWKLWMQIYGATSCLADAYLYTGDKTYARKAAILLDRVADVYPSMDWKPYADKGWFHSDGGTKLGKVEGAIWECGVVSKFATSYDKILSGTTDNPELYTFLAQCGKRYQLPRPKGSRELFVANVDDNLLRCGADAIQAGRIDGNEGMHQSAMAACAIALSTEPDTSRYLDWIFAPGRGSIPGIIVGRIDRDGLGGEGAPGYSLLWNNSIGNLAELLADYPQYTRNNLFRDFPQFRQMSTAAWRLCVLGIATPPIGDSGGTGSIGKSDLDVDRMARAYHYLHDPDIAIATFQANGNTTKGICGSILDKEPEVLADEIEQVCKGRRIQPMGSRNLPGFGLASLEIGSGYNGKALWMYYGRTDKHGHLDRLNIGLYAFGVDLAPDLGYPEFASIWPHRYAWVTNTISHNTVVVDAKKQGITLSGHPRWFRQLPGIGAFEIESREVYPQTKEYDRTSLFVEAPGDQAYVVDIFRVVGGSSHTMSFHGPPGPVETAGLKLVPQQEGTYAGVNVPYGAVDGDWPLGYSFLYNTSRDLHPPASFTLDWKAEAGYRSVKPEDNIHLRMHALTSCNEVALADGDPPQNKPGNPRRIRYALLNRKGTDLASTFVSVLEPYKDKPFIRSATAVPLSVSAGGGAALRVTLSDGTIDCFLSAHTGTRLQTETGIVTDAALAFLRYSKGKVVRAAMIGGSELRCKDITLKAAASAYQGKVEKMDKGLTGGGRIWLSGNIPKGVNLVGKQIVIENDRVLNACYDIREAVKEGDLWRIQCGPVSFVRGYKDPGDYTKGFTYNFKEGAGFTITEHVFWAADASNRKLHDAR